MYEQLNIDLGPDRSLLLSTATATTTGCCSVVSTSNSQETSVVSSTDESQQVGLVSSSNHHRLANLSHNSVLNCLFLLTSDKKLILYDCNSRAAIREIDWNDSLSESKLR